MFLEVNDVYKQYAGHLALDGVSISVPKGTVFGLLGPNGAGKTTLIRIVNGITAPDKGTVLIDGHAVKRHDASRIGYLPEERGLYKKMRVGEQAVYLCRLKGLSRHDAERRLRHWFEKFGIEEWWFKRVEELSKGMAQKVQFITTVLHEPELLIFDEPFSGFDPVNAELLKREILELRDKGATVIFSTHNMESVERLCENIALIDHSRVVLSGSVAEIRESHRSGRYHVDFRGQVSDSILLPGVEIEARTEGAGRTSMDLRLAPSVASNDVVAELVKRGEVVRFEEVLPSMNDIFIQTVSGK